MGTFQKHRACDPQRRARHFREAEILLLRLDTAVDAPILAGLAARAARVGYRHLLGANPTPAGAKITNLQTLGKQEQVVRPAKSTGVRGVVLAVGERGISTTARSSKSMQQVHVIIIVISSKRQRQQQPPAAAGTISHCNSMLQ